MDETEEHARPRLFGVLVTYDRPVDLRFYLRELGSQTRRLDHLLVVDNAPTATTEAEVRRANGAAAASVEYLPLVVNLGPAGAVQRAVMQLADVLAPPDWVVLLDDDNPPLRADLLDELLEFGIERRRADRSVAMVGLTGAKFEMSSGRCIRLADEDLHGVVDVDYVAGNQFPMMSSGAAIASGGYAERLFFGFEELELGLRLRRSGHRIVVDGALAAWARRTHGREGSGYGHPTSTAKVPPWRRYYALRNLIVILRANNSLSGALRVTAVAGLGKSTFVLLRNGRSGWRYFVLSLRGIVDGWAQRLGPTVMPRS